MKDKHKNFSTWLKGLIIGALIWLYDYDFLLNAGGPETPISDSIRKFFGLHYSNTLFPLFFLMAMASLIGGLIGWIRIKLLGRKSRGQAESEEDK